MKIGVNCQMHAVFVALETRNKIKFSQELLGQE